MKSLSNKVFQCGITATERTIYSHLKANLQKNGEFPGGIARLSSDLDLPRVKDVLARMRRKGLIFYQIKNRTMIVKLEELA